MANQITWNSRSHLIVSSSIHSIRLIKQGKKSTYAYFIMSLQNQNQK